MKHNSNHTCHGLRRWAINRRNEQQFSGRQPVEDPTARVSALLRAAALRDAGAYDAARLRR